MIFDERACTLGEGPFWHPTRHQFYWFNIRPGQLLSRDETGSISYEIGENASAAGWIDHDTLLVATETRLARMDLRDGALETIHPLESDNPRTRSNDGRVDPYGGFWIGTMDKDETRVSGAIYRYYRGTLRKLYDKIQIPNSTCFSPNGSHAYFCDTPKRQIMRVALDNHGWPQGEAEIWLDLRASGLNPDGAVIDSEGRFWCAMYGTGQVQVYTQDAVLQKSISFQAAQTTCPAFGGADLTTLICTSATQNLDEAFLRDTPGQGMVYEVPDIGQGQAEHRVELS